MAALLILLAEPLASLLGVDGEPSATYALWILGLGTPLAAALNLYTSATRGLGTMRATALLDQIARPALQLVLVSAAVFSDSALLVVLAWVLPYLPTAVAARWWWQRDLARGGTPGKEREPGMTKAFWRFTGPRALAGVGQLAMQRLDIVLVGAIAGLSEAAIYTAASRFLVLGQLAGMAISRAVQPRLARAIGAGEHHVTSELYRTATAWLVLLAWPMYLVMALTARDAAQPVRRGVHRGRAGRGDLVADDVGGHRVRHGGHGAHHGRDAPAGTSPTSWSRSPSTWSSTSC